MEPQLSTKCTFSPNLYLYDKIAVDIYIFFNYVNFNILLHIDT